MFSSRSSYTLYWRQNYVYSPVLMEGVLAGQLPRLIPLLKVVLTNGALLSKKSSALAIKNAKKKNVVHIRGDRGI